MRVWTIQTSDIWELLREKGVYHARQKNDCRLWRPGYSWMADRMHERLGPPPRAAQLPIWVWQQWGGVQRAKPDLRAWCHLPDGCGVRMELEVDDDRLLLSDFGGWHSVLNSSYYAPTERDHDRFSDELEEAGYEWNAWKKAGPAFIERVEQSWLRIFDLDYQHSDWIAPRVDKQIQGVMWELRLQDVKKVTKFQGRTPAYLVRMAGDAKASLRR